MNTILLSHHDYHVYAKLCCTRINYYTNYAVLETQSKILRENASPPKKSWEKGKKQKMKGWLGTKTFVEIHEKGVSNNVRVSKCVEGINWQQSEKNLGNLFRERNSLRLRRKLNS